MTKINVDFHQITGKIKPMHCNNMGPRQGGPYLDYDFTEEFREIGVPYVRLHDIEYPYGMNQYVDIHCVFPDFDADETLEESYHFAHTDKYLLAIQNAGSRIFYRLGESIDHFDQKLYIAPPKDMEKWARICEHIIAHYNEGWANGFHMGIRYWEIWNEPDNKKMWTGTREDFFELYRITANHLKQTFGDKIKIGGYGASGFYVNNRTENMRDWFKTLVIYMNEFFRYITAEETKAPIDFFTWHCYAEVPEEMALHTGYARELLDKYGLNACESILDEYNMYYCFSEYSPYHQGCFTDLAASMILAQKSSMDMLMHYGGLYPRGTYNNIFAMDIDDRTIIRFAGFEAMKDFGTLYRLGKEVESDGDIEGSLYVLAAKGEKEGSVMIVSRGYEGELKITLAGAEEKNCTIKRTDDHEPWKNRGHVNVAYSEKTIGTDGKLEAVIRKNEILFLTLEGVF